MKLPVACVISLALGVVLSWGIFFSRGAPFIQNHNKYIESTSMFNAVIARFNLGGNPPVSSLHIDGSEDARGFDLWVYKDPVATGPISTSGGADELYVITGLGQPSGIITQRQIACIIGTRGLLSDQNFVLLTKSFCPVSVLFGPSTSVTSAGTFKE